ncbi:MAG: lysozyme inhibitor LprI family protein [Rhizomicrobium sp.]
MKLVRAASLATAALLAFAAPAGAAKLDCNNPNTTIDIDQCAGKDYTAADTVLNALYRQLMAKYDAGNKTLLQAAQRSWIKYRDDQCAYETNMTVGGAIHPAMETNCRADLTRAQIKRLKAQRDCEEGDLSCNHP